MIRKDNLLFIIFLQKRTLCNFFQAKQSFRETFRIAKITSIVCSESKDFMDKKERKFNFTSMKMALIILGESAIVKLYGKE